MRDSPTTGVFRTIQTLFHAGVVGELTDGELLDRFVSSRDVTSNAAFEALVNRHGPMVLDVCRNVLRDRHDAEDAFQATFLILAKQARSIRRRGSVSSWLFGVASRVAAHAKADAARRRARERRLAETVPREVSIRDEVREIALHEEIAALPEKYREPVILCFLEGMSYQAAADRLGCPVGTLSVRLMRAKERLRARLTRRGEASPAALTVARHGGEPAAPPVAPDLLASLLQHATCLRAGRPANPASAATQLTDLVEGVSHAMFYKQMIIKVAAAPFFSGVLFGAGVLGYYGTQPAPPVASVASQGREEGATGSGPDSDPSSPEARAQVRSVNNLRKLGLGIIAFAQANGYLPPPAIRDPNTGRPLLSWRVAILPWIGAEQLYQQFHFNEPWDSPHNKALMERMPETYAPVGVRTKDPYVTFYQVFVGPGSAFEPLGGGRKLQFPQDIQDGAATTIAVIEAGQPVPWTKPEELPFRPDQSLPRLGGLFKEGFNLVFLDASVWSVARGVDERLLKGFITRDFGEPVNRDQLPQIRTSSPRTEVESRAIEGTGERGL
jgi:RNA polymerase sigma factor (sigma-70 family)